MKFKIETTDAAITTMVRDVLKHESQAGEGQATYLRALTAGVQVAVGGAPRIAARGRVKGIEGAAALEALTKVNARFYAIVLAEVGKKGTPKERNSKTGFARSAASTLRSALRAGLNPLLIVLPTLTKAWLRAWTAKHRPAPAAPTAAVVARQARVAAAKLHRLLAMLPDLEKAEVVNEVREELQPTGVILPFPERRNGRTAVAA